MSAQTPSQRLRSLAPIADQALSQERDKLEDYRKRLEITQEALNEANTRGDKNDILEKQKAHKQAQTEFVMQQASYREIEQAAYKLEAQLRVSHWLNKSQN